VTNVSDGLTNTYNWRKRLEVSDNEALDAEPPIASFMKSMLLAAARSTRPFWHETIVLMLSRAATVLVLVIGRGQR
jgi:hypothetical protein